MYEFITLLIAGLGAGIITGLLSASAVIFAAPIMIVFLGVPPYQAIGIALALDVFASTTATQIYKKNKNTNLKDAKTLLLTAIVFVIIGSFLSVNIPPSSLGWLLGLGVIISGIAIYARRNNIPRLHNTKPAYEVLAGILIGLIAGVFGGGGGLTILFALVFLLKYRIHEAIGTSVLIMIFVAFFGAVTHYLYQPFNLAYLLIASTGGVIGAYYSSIIANHLDEKLLIKIVGSILVLLGIILFTNNILA
ncbi:MAG: sulfite exporter TauE/SafE family protein [Candidatus Woesearchaeota archaeon]